MTAHHCGGEFPTMRRMAISPATTVPPVAPAALRPDDAFAALGIGTTYGYREIKSGRLRSFKVGKMRLVPADALAEWVVAREAEAARGTA